MISGRTVQFYFTNIIFFHSLLTSNSSFFFFSSWILPTIFSFITNMIPALVQLIKVPPASALRTADGVSGTTLTSAMTTSLRSKGSPHFSAPLWVVGCNGQWEEDGGGGKEQTLKGLVCHTRDVNSAKSNRKPWISLPRADTSSAGPATRASSSK